MLFTEMIYAHRFCISSLLLPFASEKVVCFKINTQHIVLREGKQAREEQADDDEWDLQLKLKCFAY